MSPVLQTPLGDAFRLDGRVVRPRRLLVEGPGGSERLEPQILGVLLVLAEQAGRPVSRAELFARVWDGRAVSEDVLHRAVSRLRAVFHDDARAPRVIETIPRVGYRLLVAPAPLEGARPPVAIRRATAARTWIAGAAVAVAGLVALVLPVRSRTDRPDAVLRERPFVALPGNELAPSFAPDGREVAFSWDGEDGHRRLYRMALGDAAPRRLTEPAGKDGASAWAPDGRSIAFVRIEPGGACRIVRRDVGTGAESTVASCHPSAQIRLDFSPDGRHLVWSDVPEGDAVRHAIRGLDVASGRTRWITAPPAGREDTYPAVSPDGDWLAFARGVPGATAEIHRQRLAGGRAERITWDPAPVVGLDWSARDRLVVASARAGDEPGLWRLDLDGRFEPIETGGDRRAPVASPDGERIVFESWREQSHLVRTSLDGTGTDLALAPSSRRDHSPALSPAGDRVAFVSDRTGEPQVWSVGADGTGLARLTGLQGAVPSRPAWSPDGTRLTFELRSGARYSVCVIARDGGTPDCFGDEGCALAPLFDPDGTAVLYGSDREGPDRWRIWRRDLATGATRPVTDRGFWPKAVVDDAVYYVEMRRDGLRRRTAAGSDEAVLAEPSFRLASSLAIDGSGIRFARADGTIVGCGLDGTGCREVGRVAGVHARSGLGLVGSTAVFARYRKPEVELLTLFASPATRIAAAGQASDEPRSLLRPRAGL